MNHNPKPNSYTLTRTLNLSLSRIVVLNLPSCPDPDSNPLTLTRYAALLRFKPSASRASKACDMRFRRLKVLSSTARYLFAYVERHNLTASLSWCAAVLHNHSRHPEQKDAKL